jgi:hypothetical protein
MLMEQNESITFLVRIEFKHTANPVESFHYTSVTQAIIGQYLYVSTYKQFYQQKYIQSNRQPQG